MWANQRTECNSADSSRNPRSKYIPWPVEGAQIHSGCRARKGYLPCWGHDGIWRRAKEWWKKMKLWGPLLRRLRNKKDEINCLRWGRKYKTCRTLMVNVQSLLDAFNNTVKKGGKGDITVAEVSTSESRDK